VACSSFRALLFCCRQVLLVLFCRSAVLFDASFNLFFLYLPVSIFVLLALLFGLISHVSMDFRREVRQFFGAILWLVRPSMPCCFAVGRCFWCFLFLLLLLLLLLLVVVVWSFSPPPFPTLLSPKLIC
jgi:hypothetical protein